MVVVEPHFGGVTQPRALQGTDHQAETPGGTALNALEMAEVADDGCPRVLGTSSMIAWTNVLFGVHLNR